MTAATALAQLQALDRALRRYGLLTQEVYASRFWGRDYDPEEPEMRFLVDAGTLADRCVFEIRQTLATYVPAPALAAMQRIREESGLFEPSSRLVDAAGATVAETLGGLGGVIVALAIAGNERHFITDLLAALIEARAQLPASIDEAGKRAALAQVETATEAFLGLVDQLSRVEAAPLPLRQIHRTISADLADIRRSLEVVHPERLAWRMQTLRMQSGHMAERIKLDPARTLLFWSQWEAVAAALDAAVGEIPIEAFLALLEQECLAASPLLQPYNDLT